MRPIETTKYQRIADALRREILDGTLAPGDPMPTIEQLKARFGASDRTIVEAEKLLLGEGLIISRPGTRSYVRRRPEIIRMVRSWHRDVPSGSPWRAVMAAEGRVGDWESHSEPTTAPPDVAARLGIEPGDRVMRTAYVFTADGEPVYLSTSWEPMAITKGTPILLPEDGPLAGQGVVDRMAAIGRVVSRETHEIVPHTLTEAQAVKLRLRAGVAAVVKWRTYWAGEIAVEVAEIVLPSHVRLRYEIPVG